MPGRYNSQNLKKVIENPSLLWEKRRYINHDLNRMLLSPSNQGIDVTQKNWDNLIILDAARYDIFEKIYKKSNILSGSLDYVTSKGGNSWEFVNKNFEHEELFDTIYITGNSHYQKMNSDVFFHVKPCLGQEDRLSPEKLIEQTITANNEYPHKKLITHFVIPHAPYVNSEAKKIRERLSDKYNLEFALSGFGSDIPASEREWNMHSLLTATDEGYLSDKILRETYEQELKKGMEYARNLIDDLDGKSVVTSDHGELLGDRVPPLFFKEYGHWEGLSCAALRRVPWLVVDGDRREIYRDSPVDSEEISESEINEHLEALGYL